MAICYCKKKKSIFEYFKDTQFGPNGSRLFPCVDSMKHMLGLGAIIRRGDPTGCACVVLGASHARGAQSARPRDRSPQPLWPWRRSSPAQGRVSCSLASAHEPALIINHVPVHCKNVLNGYPLGPNQNSENATSRPPSLSCYGKWFALRHFLCFKGTLRL